MILGYKNCFVGVINMNEYSFCFYVIFIIIIECSEKGIDGNMYVRMGKFYFVDFVGLERQVKIGVIGQCLKEVIKINFLFFIFGNVIFVLVDGKSIYVFYCNFKLICFFQDFLGGNLKIMMCVNIGLVDYNYDEMISILWYVNCVKNIKNKVRINEDLKDVLLCQFQKEIEELKKKFEEGEEILGFDISGLEEDDEEEGEVGEDGEKRKKRRGKKKVFLDKMIEM